MEPKVSIIITSYLPGSKRYLDLCIESIKNLDYPADDLEVIVVGRPDYLPQYEGVRTIAPEQEKFYPPVGLNFGMKAAAHELMLVLNDDTILTRRSLDVMVAAYGAMGRKGLLMPISNDQQGKYFTDVGINPGPMNFEEVGGAERFALMNFVNQIGPGSLSLSFHDTLCIYAFLISKSAYEQVGDFDESLIGQDDIDYTMRIARKGMLNAICYNAIIYHFGGVSADHTLKDVREESMNRFLSKWRS